MKTDLYLLMLTEGNPVMSIKQLADLLGLSQRTVENKHYRQDLSIPLFKIEGGGLFAHVSDVSKHIEDQRAAAVKMLATEAGRVTPVSLAAGKAA